MDYTVESCCYFEVILLRHRVWHLDTASLELEDQLPQTNFLMDVFSEHFKWVVEVFNSCSMKQLRGHCLVLFLSYVLLEEAFGLRAVPPWLSSLIMRRGWKEQPIVLKRGILVDSSLIFLETLLPC